MKRYLLAILAFLWVSPAFSQTTPNFGLVPTSASTIAAGTSSANIQLDTRAQAGDTTLIQNSSTTTEVFLAFGTTAGVAATTSGFSLPPGRAIAFSLPAGSYVAAITASGAANVRIIRGQGSTAMASLGSTGGGGGGAVSSVFGRSGDVTAQSGDYTCAQVTNCPDTLTGDVTKLSGSNITTLATTQSGAHTFTNQNTFAAGTITASAPTQFTQTWNNAAVSFNALLVNVTETAAATTSMLIDLQRGGVSQFNVSRSGSVTITGNLNATGGNATSSSITAAAAGAFLFTGRSRIKSTADGQLDARNNADSAYSFIRGKLETDTNYTAGATTATGYVTLYDATGAAYKVNACLASGC